MNNENGHIIDGKLQKDHGYFSLTYHKDLGKYRLS